MSKLTDIRIEEVSCSHEDFIYRTPIKFGGVVVDRATILNVNCMVSTVNGRKARGFGSMPLGNVWAFPSRLISYELTLSAMRTLAERVAKLTADYKEFSHPIDINLTLEPSYLQAAREVTKELKLPQPVPKLATLVTASAFDAAVHDAFGKVHGLNCYSTYGPDFMGRDLSYYLGLDFQGESLSQYVLKNATLRLPLYHLVGAVDPILESDVKNRVGDGLPETLPEWIKYNGLTHFKIKLNGGDPHWDLERVIYVDRVAAETEKALGVKNWVYSLDFNEQCPNVQYLLEFIYRLKEKAAGAYNRIQYIEQPTARDLELDPENVMHEASKFMTIVIDESLTGLDRLMLARERGYTGIALKACKGQSQSLLLAAVAQKYKMFLCVQDLTCPGASLIHSAGLAAHVPTVAAIEANARQYVPAANRPWEARFPGIFTITDGAIKTTGLDKPGLSAVEADDF